MKRYLWEHGRIPLAHWESQTIVRRPIPAWAKEFATKGSIPVVQKPEDIVLFVAGSGMPIPQHVFFPTWVQNVGPGRITKEIRVPAAWKNLIEQEK